jgi:hypothetical protein
MMQYYFNPDLCGRFFVRLDSFKEERPICPHCGSLINAHPEYILDEVPMRMAIERFVETSGDSPHHRMRDQRHLDYMNGKVDTANPGDCDGTHCCQCGAKKTKDMP